MNTPLPSAIPWLAQVTPEASNQLGPVWDTVLARGSREAALAYAQSSVGIEYGERFVVHIAPAAALLRYPNGMPKFCRAFTFKREIQATLTA